MSEFTRLSPEAYERKKEYNRQYAIKYRENNDLTVIKIEVDKNFNRVLSNLLLHVRLSKRDFINWTCNLLEVDDNVKEK